MKKVSLHWTPLQRILLFLPATLHNFDESQSPRWSILSAGDVVGFVLAWFSLLPVFILVGLGTLILVRRDLQTMFFTGGLVANEGVNFILKHLIQEPRPINAINPRPLFGKYGMPSSHAQFMGWFATYFSLFIFIKTMLSIGSLDYVWKTICTGVAVCTSVLCCASRIYLGYHTMAQVLYGVVLGAGVAVLWFTLVQVFCEPYFSQIYQWSVPLLACVHTVYMMQTSLYCVHTTPCRKVSELLLLKDMSRIPNYMWFEYTSVRQETKSVLSSFRTLLFIPPFCFE
jgi:dolichyldiphosphatase